MAAPGRGVEGAAKIATIATAGAQFHDGFIAAIRAATMEFFSRKSARRPADPAVSPA